MTVSMRPNTNFWSACAVGLAILFSLSTAARAAEPDADRAAWSYVDSVRTSLNRGKRFPTGRDVSLQQSSGRTEVTFTLTRRGKVTAVKTTQSSNSMPIDDMARQLVHRARYPAFPAEAWAGSPTHTFVVAYNFTRGATGSVQVGEAVEVKAQ